MHKQDKISGTKDAVITIPSETLSGRDRPG